MFQILVCNANEVRTKYGRLIQSEPLIVVGAYYAEDELLNFSRQVAKLQAGFKKLDGLSKFAVR